MKTDLKKLADQSVRATETHFVVQCPTCKTNGKIKDKLYIRKDHQVGYCFVCNTVYQNERSEFNYRRGLLSDKTFTEVVSIENIKIEFDKYKSFDKNGIEYLRERNANLYKDYSKYSIRFGFNKCVIPFYFEKKLIYYIFRNYTGEMKYFNPPIKNKPLYIPPFYNIKEPHTLVITEGVFDAIACNYLFDKEGFMPIALLGSTITNYQLGLLEKANFNKVIIFMDELGLSEKVREKTKI